MRVLPKLSVASIAALAGCGGGSESAPAWECAGQTIPGDTARHAEVDVEVRPVGGDPFVEHYSGGCAPVHKLPGTPTGDELCEWPTTQFIDETEHAVAYFSFDTPQFMRLQLILQGNPTLDEGVVGGSMSGDVGDEGVGGGVSVKLTRRDTPIGPVLDAEVAGELSNAEPGAALDSVALDGTFCFLDEAVDVI